MFFLTPAFDLELFVLINQHLRCGLFNLIMPIISSTTILFAAMGVAAIAAVLLRGKRQLIYMLILVAAMGLSDFTTGVVKDQVQRVRPLNAVAGTHQYAHGFWQQVPHDFVQTKETGTSYPSAHSSTTMAVAVLSMLLWPGLKKWPLLLPLFVGYSRVYVGKHYPTDVLAGWLFGLGVAIVIWMVWRHGVSRLLPGDD